MPSSNLAGFSALRVMSWIFVSNLLVLMMQSNRHSLHSAASYWCGLLVGPFRWLGSQ
jgi:hypothetical protein